MGKKRYTVHPGMGRNADRALSTAEIAVGKELLADDDLARLQAQRPRTRADCVDGPRPCPWLACRHHLWVDVTSGGSVRVADHDGVDVESCALDVADMGGVTFQTCADAMGLSKQRCEQIEAQALRRLLVWAEGQGYTAADVAKFGDRRGNLARAEDTAPMTIGTNGWARSHRYWLEDRGTPGHRPVGRRNRKTKRRLLAEQLGRKRRGEG